MLFKFRIKSQGHGNVDIEDGETILMENIYLISKYKYINTIACYLTDSKTNTDIDIREFEAMIKHSICF